MAAFGGAGYDSNMFGGGGFMVSQQPDIGAAGGGGDQGKRRDQASLRHMTIRHLLKQVQGQEDNPYRVDGADLSHVKVVGKILEVRPGNAAWTITITDGTGQIDLQHWMDDNDWQLDLKRNSWKPGAYVAAHGDCQKDKQTGGKRINAFNIRLVTDFNEVTFHQLQAIHEHLFFTHGAAGGAPQAGFGGAPMAGAYAPQAAGGGAAPGGFGGMPAAKTAGMDPCAAGVMNLLVLPEIANGDNGLHINEVVQRLNNAFPAPKVKQALLFLQNEGHVFSTIDDDHWKAAA